MDRMDQVGMQGPTFFLFSLETECQRANAVRIKNQDNLTTRPLGGEAELPMSLHTETEALLCSYT